MKKVEELPVERIRSVGTRRILRRVSVKRRPAEVAERSEVAEQASLTRS